MCKACTEVSTGLEKSLPAGLVLRVYKELIMPRSSLSSRDIWCSKFPPTLSFLISAFGPSLIHKDGFPFPSEEERLPRFHLIFLKINKIKKMEVHDLLARRLVGLKLGRSHRTSQDPQLSET